MKKRIWVTLVQPDLIWENPMSNLQTISGMLDENPHPSDLIILPETFSTGFTMRAGQFAEERNGPAASWMQGQAKKRKAYVTGSLIVRDQDRIYNRLYWVSPEGIEGQYDKRHLFRMGRENEFFTPGVSRVVFRLGEFRFLPQICYDIRFPVFARNRNDYDILFYVANWPVHRHRAWEILLRARAVENQAYVLGVTRVGKDGEGVDHLGGTCAIDPRGRVKGTLDERPGILNVSIDLERIREYREKFPVWKDADRFTID